MAPRESDGGANAITADQVMTDNVNGRPGSNENASSRNGRNVFAESGSGLIDESRSSGKLRLPVERTSEARGRLACGHASESLRHWPWRL